MIQRYDIEKAMSSVSLIISGLHICFFSFLHSSAITYNIYSLLGQLDLDMLLLKSQDLELTDIPLFFW
jgi:hypothetical protein